MAEQTPFRPKHLHYFVVVAHEGQMTRAAARLKVAQPALTQAIAQLESELGFRLFVRGARGVTLTAAGRAFLETAERAVSAAGDAERTARSLARAQRGVIEFGFLGTPPGVDSPDDLRAFASRHPAIDILFRELPFPSASTSAWLAEVDVAACHAPPPDRAVIQVPIRTEPRVLIVPAAHPLASLTQTCASDVLDEQYIGFHPTVERSWAGFWSLDDVRGGPPPRVTAAARAHRRRCSPPSAAARRSRRSRSRSRGP